MNILQHKYSDIQKETERKQGQQPQQNETENETKSKVAKVKFHRKLIENKVCIVGAIRIISSTDTSVQKENEMNNHAESKTTGEQVIKDRNEKKKKKKKNRSKKNSTQDTANTVKNRSNDHRKSKKSVVVA